MDELSTFEKLVMQEWPKTDLPQSLNAFMTWHRDLLARITNISEVERQEHEENIIRTWVNVCLSLQHQQRERCQAEGNQKI